MSGFQVARLDEMSRTGAWIPIRRHLGIAAFGVNGWRGDEGDEIIPVHEEEESGHEELYVVIAGRATFDVAGRELDAPAGAAVFVRDPALPRGAVAREPGTTVLSVGAKPGEAYAPRSWEENAEVLPLFERGEFARARDLLVEALERHPGAGGLLYNLACAEARLGEREQALTHLQRAISLEPRLAEAAAEDPDLESIRDDPRFRSAVAGEPAPGGASA